MQKPEPGENFTLEFKKGWFTNPGILDGALPIKSISEPEFIDDYYKYKVELEQSEEQKAESLEVNIPAGKLRKSLQNRFSKHVRIRLTNTGYTKWYNNQKETKETNG